MGLRELKTERTRAQIVKVAQDLFLSQGFAATTMEQVAASAEVGTSTLYRYFPSKELLLLEPFAHALDFSKLLDERPVDEPLANTLGAIIRAAFPQGDLEHERFVALWLMVEREPGPRARLWDLFDGTTRELERAFAKRLDRPADDLQVALAAQSVLVIHSWVSRRWAGSTRRSWEQTVDSVLESLGELQLVLPR